MVIMWYRYVINYSNGGYIQFDTERPCRNDPKVDVADEYCKIALVYKNVNLGSRALP